MNIAVEGNAAIPVPREERALLWLLAALQFTTMLDYLIIMPLGPQYLRLFHITPGQFGLMVSAYALSAGITGFIAGFVLDRFRRSQALNWVYLGFGISTIGCAIAPTYHWLLAARFVAGAFGGLTGALILAVIADNIPVIRRGKALGMVMSAFSIASVAGVPIGLKLANSFGWHAPFFALGVASIGLWFFLRTRTPNLSTPPPRPHGSAWQNWLAVVTPPAHWRGLVLIALITSAGFVVHPYISPYMVKNVGLPEAHLPYVYLVGGGFTIFSMNLIGPACDRFGQMRVYTIMCLCTMGASLAITHLPPVPSAVAILSMAVYMVSMSGRMIPGMALITQGVDPRYRGGFMSTQSAVQHLASGIAAYLAGVVLAEGADGRVVHFEWMGWASAAFTLLGLLWGTTLAVKRTKKPDSQGEPVSLAG